MVLAATNAAKKSAARAHMPYKCVCCDLIALEHSAVSLLSWISDAHLLTHSLTHSSFRSARRFSRLFSLVLLPPPTLTMTS